MDGRALTAVEFRNFLGWSMQVFFEDLAARASTGPDPSEDAMTAHQWLGMFSEFAVAELVNPPVASSAAEDGNARHLAACDRCP